jgi:hypothetical protein
MSSAITCISAIAQWNEGVRSAYFAAVICAFLRCISNSKAETAIFAAVSSGHDLIKGLAKLQKQAVASAEGGPEEKTAFVKSLCEAVLQLVKLCQKVSSILSINEKSRKKASSSSNPNAADASILNALLSVASACCSLQSPSFLHVSDHSLFLNFILPIIAQCCDPSVASKLIKDAVNSKGIVYVEVKRKHAQEIDCSASSLYHSTLAVTPRSLHVTSVLQAVDAMSSYCSSCLHLLMARVPLSNSFSVVSRLLCRHPQHPVLALKELMLSADPTAAAAALTCLQALFTRLSIPEGTLGQWLLPHLMMFMCSESPLIRAAAAAAVVPVAEAAKNVAASASFDVLGTVHVINSETCSYLRTSLTDASSAIAADAGHFIKFMHRAFSRGTCGLKDKVRARSLVDMIRALVHSTSFNQSLISVLLSCCDADESFTLALELIDACTSGHLRPEKVQLVLADALAKAKTCDALELVAASAAAASVPFLVVAGDSLNPRAFLLSPSKSNRCSLVTVLLELAASGAADLARAARNILFRCQLETCDIEHVIQPASIGAPASTPAKKKSAKAPKAASSDAVAVIAAHPSSSELRVLTVIMELLFSRRSSAHQDQNESSELSLPNGIVPPLCGLFARLLPSVLSPSQVQDGNDNDESVGDSEFVVQLVLECLGAVVAQGTALPQAPLPTVSARDILAVVHKTSSPGTRNAAVSLIAGLADVQPQHVLDCLDALLDAISSAAGATEDGWSRDVVHNCVARVVPCLLRQKVHAKAVFSVFTQRLSSIPTHRQLPLLLSLCNAAGAAMYAHGILTLILKPEVTPPSVGGSVKVTSSAGDDKRDDKSNDLALRFIQLLPVHLQVQALRTGLQQFIHKQTSDADAQQLLLTSAQLFVTSSDGARLAATIEARTLTLAARVLSSPIFERGLLQLSEEEEKELQPEFLGVFRNSMVLLRQTVVLLRTAGNNPANAAAIHRTVALAQKRCVAVVDAVQHRLTADGFVACVGALLRHSDHGVRRRALQHLSQRLSVSNVDQMTKADLELFMQLTRDVADAITQSRTATSKSGGLSMQCVFAYACVHVDLFG